MPLHELLELKEEINKVTSKRVSSVPVPLLGEHLLSLLRRRMELTDWSQDYRPINQATIQNKYPASPDQRSL